MPSSLRTEAPALSKLQCLSNAPRSGTDANRPGLPQPGPEETRASGRYEVQEVDPFAGTQSNSMCVAMSAES